MKIADRCQADIQAIINEHKDDNGGIQGEHLVYWIYHDPEGTKWSINYQNVFDTARSLGFTVIGNMIYGLDM